MVLLLRNGAAIETLLVALSALSGESWGEGRVFASTFQYLLPSSLRRQGAPFNGRGVGNAARSCSCAPARHSDVGRRRFFSTTGRSTPDAFAPLLFSSSSRRRPGTSAPRVGFRDIASSWLFRQRAAYAAGVSMARRRREANPCGTLSHFSFAGPRTRRSACERRSRPARGEVPWMAPALRSEEGRRAGCPESKSHGD